MLTFVRAFFFVFKIVLLPNHIYRPRAHFVQLLPQNVCFNL